MRYIILFTIFFFISFVITAQNKFTIKGKVSDNVSQEWLVGVSVGIKEIPQYGDFTDQSGNYSLQLLSGEYTLIYKLLGYYTKEVWVTLVKGQTLRACLNLTIIKCYSTKICANN